MKDLKIFLGVFVAFSVLAGIAAYVLVDEDIDLLEFVGIVVVPTLLVFGALFILSRRIRAARAGLPAEDEFSRKVNYMAGYYAYIASIYVALAGMMFELEAEELGAAVILIPAVVFMGSYIHLERRGEKQ